MHPSSKFRFSRLLFALGALVLPSFSFCAAEEPPQLDLARQQVLADRFPQALATVQDFLNSGPGKTDTDVATLLEAGIVFRIRGDKACEEILNGFSPDAADPRVQAEQLRLKAVRTTQSRVAQYAAYEELLKKFPDQFSGYDFYKAVQTYYSMPWANQNRPRFEKEVINPVAARLGDSPLVPWTKALTKHFKEGAPEGLVLIRQAEKGLKEPLLSAARSRELIFLGGNVDNKDRFEQAKALAHTLIADQQVDIGQVITAISNTLQLRTQEHPDAVALWLGEEAKAAPTPEVAAVLYEALLNEWLNIGRSEEALKLIADLKASGFDAKVVQRMEAIAGKLVWQIEGQLPASWLASDRVWRIEAIEASLPGQGVILATTTTKPDSSGHFSLKISGPKIMALVAYYRPANGMPVLRVLAENLKAGTPLTIDESKYVRNAMTAPPAPAPNTIVLNERFGKEWQPQLIQFHLPKRKSVDPEKLRVVDSQKQSVPCQYLGEDEKSTIVGVWRGLKPNEQETLTASFDDSSIPVATLPAKVTISSDSDGSRIVDTGAAQFKIPADSASSIAPEDAAKYAYVLGAKGPDGVWRGKADWVGDSTPKSLTVKRTLDGPIRTSFVLAYEFANGTKRDVTLSFDAGQPVMLIDEKGEGDYPGEFQLRFVPEDGFDMFASQQSPHRDLEPLVNRKPQMWFRVGDYPYGSAGPSNALLAGIFSSNKERKDFFSVFAVHPGDWFDPSYKEAFTPVDLNPEEQWFNPFRYTGSVNSAISGRVVETGAVTYEIPLTPGTRRWAVLIMPHDSLNPDSKFRWDSQYVVDRYNRGDLSRYLTMALQWASPAEEHGPTRDQIHNRLLKLQADKDKGLFKLSRDAEEGKNSNSTWLMAMGIEDDDPALIWFGWHTYADYFDWIGQASTDLETTDKPDSINPVSCRRFIEMALAYIVADELGMLTDEQRMHCRAASAIIAYRMWSPDMMNWRMNTGQPNFELDRLDQVRCFADTFPDHPEAKEMREHVIRQTKEALRQYTVRDGGKWAENAGNYYLYSFELVARIASGLKLNGGLEELLASPYFEPFCRFHTEIAIGKAPADTTWLKRNDFKPEPMDQWVRYTLGVGSHSGDGGRRVDQGVLTMAEAVEKLNPKLASDLVSLWKSSGNYFLGGRTPELLFFGSASLPEVPEFTMPPRRLPGFGVFMRDGMNTDKEFCLSIHAGVSGYRDEPANGGISLNALGHPLSLIGNEGAPTGCRTNLVFATKNNPREKYYTLQRMIISRWLFSDDVQYARADSVPEDLRRPGDGSKLPGSSLAYEKLLKAEPQGDPMKTVLDVPRTLDPTRVSRDIVFARNDYVVFQDKYNIPTQGYFNFATPAVSVEQKPGGTLCRGKLGVDVWLIPLASGTVPAALEPEDLTFTNERTTDVNLCHQLSVKIPIEQSSDTILYPVRSGGKPPKTEPLGPNAWRIAGGSFDDVLFTGSATQMIPGIGNVVFQGDMALLRRKGKSWSFNIVNGTSVTIAGRQFTANEPETILYDGRSFREVTGDNQPKQ